VSYLDGPSRPSHDARADFTGLDRRQRRRARLLYRAARGGYRHSPVGALVARRITLDLLATYRRPR
jgi:hypothetical protein